MSAIGNAEAAPAARPAGTERHFAGTVAGLGAGEAQRGMLTEADADAIVRQAAEREAAAGEYERGGRAAEAARLRKEPGP